MATTSVLRNLRQLISEVRSVTSGGKLTDSTLTKYIFSQHRQYKETGEQLCKAREEMKFLSQTYLCYLQSQRKFLEIHAHFHGKGERSIRDTATLVGFKLPHDPK